MMPPPNLCIDASVGVKWIFPEESREQAFALYLRSQQAHSTILVPPHFPIEVTNAIRRRVARRLITHAQGRDALHVFSEFSVRLSTPGNLYEEALDLAETFNRPTVYDAHYVALARILGCDLWTADEALLHALGGRAPWVRAIREFPLA